MGVTTTTIQHAMPTTITMANPIHMAVNNKSARYIIFRLMFNTREVLLTIASKVTTTSIRAAATSTTVATYSFTFCMV